MTAAVATVLVLLVALAHVGFAALEMVLWTRPAGRSAFGLSAELAEQTRTLAANQGLYNLFLAAGLGWGLVARDDLQTPVLVFFTGCVVVAGVFGTITVSRRILLVQAVPGLLALGAVLLAA